jgi:hypothetical protein
MPIVEDAQQTLQRFSKYVQELIDLFKRFDITGSKALWCLWKAIGNGEFRKAWNRIWIEIAESDGGKLTLATVLTIIGAVLGGVGIAALGGAFGLPLALLFAPIGYLLGAEIDSMGLVRRIKAYLTGSEEPTAESPEPTSDIEQLAELVSALLARCEQIESLVGGATSQVEDLERRVASAEGSASALRSDVFKLERRTTYLSWANVVLAVLLVAHLVWDLISRGAK